MISTNGASNTLITLNGSNGENKLRIEGATPAEAWWRAVEEELVDCKDLIRQGWSTSGFRTRAGSYQIERAADVGDVGGDQRLPDLGLVGARPPRGDADVAVRAAGGLIGIRQQYPLLLTPHHTAEFANSIHCY
jgi:hypothetical protein